MIVVMLSGCITKPPEVRTAKNGSQFAVTTLRVQTAEGDLFASITAFGELAPTLAGLAKGDPVTVIGQARVSTYQGKDGEHRAGLSITASRIIALIDHQERPKERKPRGNGQPRRFTEYTQPDQRDYSPDSDDRYSP